MRVDINADVGESAGDDAGLMKAITSANVAAGFHAGSATTIRDTIRLAKAALVSVGVHPSFPDREGFGRREMHLTATEIEDLVGFQVSVVTDIARSDGVALQHVKPHGALYNMAARDADVAAAIARAVAAFDRALILMGPPRSEILQCGRAAGLRVAAEAFADRGYEADGSLMSRAKAGSVIHDPEVVAARALRMVRDHCVVAWDGTLVAIDAETICVHGDTPGAGRIAARLRGRLESAGVIVTPIGASQARTSS
jgi:5-oxoprolinase (ATP-hydrolysing) subunit A